MSYKTLKATCLKERKLWEDPDFPCVSKSIYFSKPDTKIIWKRPHEIVRSPKFMVEGASRFDFDQGQLGNCWYIAACATLATRKELLKNVVPQDQTFNEGDYAGIFHFNFWRYGHWVEVVIDDRLPFDTRRRRLIFCRNRDEASEFWTALLEKAYAKLHGSYEALEGGWTEDAYVDFTGGVGQRIDLRDKSRIPSDMFDTLLHDYSMNTLMACSINATKDTMETRLNNGLVIGHAYSITKVAQVIVNRTKVQLIRVRNPWGQKEWNGAWSDGSREWRSLSSAEREEMGIVNEEDGEFWMSFQDWALNYEQLQVCHLPTDLCIANKREWKQQVYHGAWVKGISAGGCGNRPYKEQFWTNPQYSITLKEPDDDNSNKECTMVVSLMQKYGRKMRTTMKTRFANQAINFSLYKVRTWYPKKLQGQSYSEHALLKAQRGGPYSYYREITQEFKLEPGTYVVIPATYYVDVERDFILRMYTEKETESNEVDESDSDAEEKSARNILEELFQRYGGNDGVVDARELQLILNAACNEELQDSQQFELEPCRSLLSMADSDNKGALQYNDLANMWNKIITWQGVFKQFDKDGSGFIEANELVEIFKSVGYDLSQKVLQKIVHRYGGKGQMIAFNDFILVLTKVVGLMGEEGEEGNNRISSLSFTQLFMALVVAVVVVLYPSLFAFITDFLK